MDVETLRTNFRLRFVCIAVPASLTVAALFYFAPLWLTLIFAVGVAPFVLAVISLRENFERTYINEKVLPFIKLQPRPLDFQDSDIDFNSAVLNKLKFSSHFYETKKYVSGSLGTEPVHVSLVGLEARWLPGLGRFLLYGAVLFMPGGSPFASYHWEREYARTSLGRWMKVIFGVWLFSCGILLAVKVSEPFAGLLRVVAGFGIMIVLALSIVWLMRPRDKDIEPPALAKAVEKMLQGTYLTCMAAGRHESGSYLIVSFGRRYFLPRVFLPIDCQPKEWPKVWSSIAGTADELEKTIPNGAARPFRA